jgi:hypothetical protein
MRETAGGAFSGCQGHTAFRMKKPAAFPGMFPAIAAQFLSYESFGLKDELKAIAVARRSESALEDSRKTAPFPGCSLQSGSQSDN